LIYPLQRLKEEDFEVSGFFYNPNIHPLPEYNRRKQALIGLSNSSNINITYPEYNPCEFFREVSLKEESPQRCSICWRLRLNKTAQVAKENEFDFFSTTLLVSPYQDQELIKKIGDDIADRFGINFYYEDFRSGFRKAHEEAHAKGIYCQNYCGCIYSQIERCKRSEKY